MHPADTCTTAPAGRRRFLATAAATFGAALACPRLAQSAPAPQRYIDVHHHFEPTGKTTEGNPWSIEMSLEELERNRVAAAIAWSGPVFATDKLEARKRARDLNEWGMRHCLDHPGRFGLFASLPMNGVDASLAEIAHAFDVLKVDGVGIATNYGEAWLGDPKFEPIFQELNRRKAVVWVHPYTAPCCTPSTLTYQAGAMSPPWIEFPTNTARTILSLWYSGTTRRLPEIRFIFAHGGGVMPILLGRFAGFSGWKTVGPDGLAALFPHGIYAEFAKLHFECAQAYAPETMELLLKTVPASHLLFGTDFSYFPVAHAVELFGKLDLPDDTRDAIKGRNAAALLPRWSSA